MPTCKICKVELRKDILCPACHKPFETGELIYCFSQMCIYAKIEKIEEKRKETGRYSPLSSLNINCKTHFHRSCIDIETWTLPGEGD